MFVRKAELLSVMKAIGRLEINMKSSLQRCVFGRLPSNEVVLEHLSISRQHAQLTLDAAGDLFITDLGSGMYAFLQAPQIVAAHSLVRRYHLRLDHFNLSPAIIQSQHATRRSQTVCKDVVLAVTLDRICTLLIAIRFSKLLLIQPI